MEKARYVIVLFDADDTLFDFGKAARAALEHTLKQHGLPCSESLHQVYMQINQGVWERLERGEITREELALERFRLFFEETGLSAPLEKFNEEYLTALGNGCFLLPGAEELCREVSRYCRMAIVTNGFYRVQTSRMEQSGLSAYFEAVYVSEQIGYQKPRREFFDAVLADLGVQDTSRVVLLGDSLTSDMAGAIGAGIPCCWYNPTGKDRKGLPVDYEISALPDFLSILLEDAG